MAGKRLRKPVHLVLDWDGTLTVNDTLAAIGSIPQFRDERLERRHDPTITWDEISRAYASDYKGHKQACFPTSTAAATATDGVPDHTYREWLNGLKAVEMRSALRAQSSGFFHGVTTEDVKRAAAAALAAGTVQLRPGWTELFEMFLVDRSSPEEPNAAAKISILSVSWCETFIRWSLWYAARQTGHPRRHDICQLINDMEIYANEIHGLSSPLGSSGRLILKRMLPIQTSGEKAKYMPPTALRRPSSHDVARQALSPPPPGKSRLPAVVYVGDSATDYECLRAADAGIWIADVPDAEHAQKFRDVFHPLEADAVPLLGSQEPAAGTILWTPDLGTVTQYLSAP